MWTDDQVQMLIDIRKEKNESYHQLCANMKSSFWKETVSKINLCFETGFTGRQASNKFQDIVRDCKVNNYSIIQLFNYQLFIETT